jgi:N-acetylglucosaminyldiphosphoundecaprenol N-acetyl-beta-D-mannosaminyltransferase
MFETPSQPLSSSSLPTFPILPTPIVPVERQKSSPPQQQVERQQVDRSPWIQPPRCDVWEVPFDQLTLPQAVNKIAELIQRGAPSYVITANLNYVMLHHRDESMWDVTRDASLILADGQPIVLRSRMGGDPLPQRVAGSEMIYSLAQRAADQGWGIYFLGGMPGVAATCAERLTQLYPGLKVAGVESPPYRELTADEQNEQDARIRDSGAKLLLVAFGQPKGEQWIHQHYQRLGVPVSIQLGASFDFIAGTATRAPAFFQKSGMEWAYRMLSDPQRLVPRYWSNATFLAGALIHDWKRTVTKWGMGDWV